MTMPRGIHKLGSLAEPRMGMVATGCCVVRSRFLPKTDYDEKLLAAARQELLEGEGRRPVVRVTAKGYELLAGVLEWEAARQDGAPEVACRIYSVADREAGLVMFAENHNRKGVSPIDEAELALRLMECFGFDQGELGAAAGIRQSTVSHLVRLKRGLAPQVQELLRSGRLELGKAKALMGLEGAVQVAVAESAVFYGWSVRRVEHEVRHRLGERVRREGAADIARLEQELTEALGNQVRFELRPNGSGVIRIEYFSLEEAEGIIERIRGPRREWE